jgi:putative transcriptional regulator
LCDKLKKRYNIINSYAENRRQPSIEDLYKIAEIIGIVTKNLLIESKEKK